MATPKPPFPEDKQLKKPVCVFCGSSPGSLSIYGNAAKAVGRALAENGIPLVYGGGRRGLMGVVSSATLEAGGYVHGILPKALVERASEHTPAPGQSTDSSNIKSQEGQGGDLIKDDYEGRMTMEVTQGMHERKLKMAQYSTGGFIVLPGGYGTFEEMMEMITWNQLDIHALPVMVLNIGNFYAPVRTLLEGAVAAGFIQEKNLQLVNIVDLSGGKAANFEESRVEEWGPAVIKALNEWTPPGGGGYGLKWEEEIVEKDSPSSKSFVPSFSLFTTLRYTNIDTKGKGVDREDLPLWPYHVQRLQKAHEHFARRDGTEVWGLWPGEEAIWEAVRTKLDVTSSGDWRVRLLLHPNARIEVQAVPAPGDAGPFQLLPTPEKGKTRQLILDPETSDVQAESSEDLDLRLYKTTDRRVYDAATERAPGAPPKPEVLLHTDRYLLETATSNIAIQNADGGWLTPRLDRVNAPFLDGVMRRYLLDQGVVQEAELTIDDLHRAKREGRRVIGFNGLRGVWEASLI